MNNHIQTQLHWVWAATAGWRSRIGISMILEIMSTVLQLFFVYFSKEAIDIATGVAPGNLKMMLIYIVLSIVLSIALSLAASWISEYVRNGLTMRLQNSLAHTQMMIAWGMKKRWHTGDLLVRLNTDCAEVVQMLVFTLPSLIVTGFKLITALAFLWAMDPLLAQLILTITPLFLLSKIYYKKMRKINRDVKRAESNLGTVMQENLKNRPLIQALLFTQARERKLTEAQESFFEVKIKQLNFSTLSQGILKLTFNGGYLLAFLWGIYRLYTGLISYGTMVAFLQLVGRVQIPVFSIVGFLPAAIRFRTALERLMELNTGEREDYRNPIRLASPISLKINNIYFKYDELEVIRHLNVAFQSGQPTAILGASGKGKTTLIRLILALIKPDSGSLTLIGHDGVSHEISVATRINIAYVPQGNTLFFGTIRENLMLANARASEEQIREALRIACAEFVYSLADGIDTMIGESGHGISEGQAQRIAIARALLQGGSVWLLDEPTSALDNDTIRQILRNLLDAGKDKILIFVTHDRYVETTCSQIVRLD